MGAKSPFLDPSLKKMARSVMIGHLRLYFETAISVDTVFTPEVVAKANLMMMELEDEESMSDDRLLFLYTGAVSQMGDIELLRNFTKIPALFFVKKQDLSNDTKPDIE